jgi:signal transduction histidine kinase
LIRTFNALLLIARTEAGAGSDAFVTVDVSELLADFVEIYEPSAEDAGCVLNAEIEPGLSVQGNRELLGQVVANLIDNALKYGLPPQSGAAAEIALSARREGDSLLIRIADHGPGIPADKHGKAVERFGRLDESRNKPGSGLGLSLASAVAHLHKGRLVLGDNQPGLAVTLELPLLPVGS